MSKETIRKLVAGEPPTPMEVDYFNEVVDYLNAIIDLKTDGLSWKITRSIAELKIDRGEIATILGIAFVVDVAGNPNASTVALTVSPGTVNGIPGDIKAVPLDNNPAPFLTTSLPQGVVFLVCGLSWDFDSGSLGVVQQVEVQVAATVPENELRWIHLPLATFKTAATDGVRSVTEINQLTSGDKRLLVWQGEFVFV